MDYFRKLAGNGGAGKPHPGTMPGSAGPDVEPPPRPHGPKQPNEDDLKVLINAGLVSPMLLPSRERRCGA